MKKGPAPKPTALRVLQGNPGKRPLNRHEPKPKRVKTLRMPVGLDEHAQKFWRRYAGKLKTLGLLSEIDLDLLTMGAQWFSIHTRAVAELKDSLIQVSEANGRVARPEIAIAKQAAAIVRAVLAEFGIGPASRSKVSAIPTELDDPVEAYKRKHSARRFLA